MARVVVVLAVASVAYRLLVRARLRAYLGLEGGPSRINEGVLDNGNDTTGFLLHNERCYRYGGAAPG